MITLALPRLARTPSRAMARRALTMDVRANRGYQLVGVGAPFVAIWIGMTQHLPMAARVVALIFAALGPYAVLKWRRTVRARFAEAAQELSSGQVAEVRAAAKTL